VQELDIALKVSLHFEIQVTKVGVEGFSKTSTSLCLLQIQCTVQLYMCKQGITV
jgi:hypothetical protein